MVIFKKLRYIVFGLLMLFVNIDIYGRVNFQSQIDTIRLTFSYMGGYVPYIAMANYVCQNDVYQLQTIQTYESDCQQLPKTICKEDVTNLLSDCSLYSSETQCDYISITKDDYSDYKRILNDFDSLLYYLPLLDFPSYSKDFKKEQYELEENEYLSLNCCDLIKIADSHFSHLFIPSKPLIKIEFVESSGETIIIEPQAYYKGTPWVIYYQGKETYVNFEYVMSFLRNIQFARYAYFLDRFYFLLQIAESRLWGSSFSTNGYF